MSVVLRENWEERAASAIALWSLEGVSWRPEVSTARVGFCTGSNGPAVLKVSIEPNMVGFEAAALRHFGPEICPTVLGLSTELESILLEQYEVAEELSHLYPQPAQEVDIWLSIFDGVRSRSEVPQGFPTLAQYSEIFVRAQSMTRDSDVRRLMAYANDHKAILMGDSSENRLLHGDMHHFNVIRDVVKGWRLIDPHGVIGHPLYELGAFLRNPWGACYIEPGVRDRLSERVAVLAERLSIPESVVAEYGFFGAAISVAWSIEEGSTDVDGMVVMAEACLGEI